MPVHDWTCVDVGIFHDFYHAWIFELVGALNSGVLPHDYYALLEPHGTGFGPDALAPNADDNGRKAEVENDGSLLFGPPRTRITAETEMEFYRRKQNAVVVRHVSGDHIVAVVEVVSPGNKAGRAAVRSFVEKAAELLEHRIHMLILDLHPPGRRDPQGIHGLIWEEISGEEFAAPPDKPLTLAAYESSLLVRAFVEPLAVGDVLVDMPLFLEPGAHVLIPLERTYERAFAAMPSRWRVVLEKGN